jgi:hypothetical protein
MSGEKLTTKFDEEPLAFNQYPTPYNNIHNALIVNALL